MPWDPVLYHSNIQCSLYQFGIGKMWRSFVLLVWKHQICLTKSDSELPQLQCECSHKIIWKYHKSTFKMQTVITVLKLMHLHIPFSVFLCNCSQFLLFSSLFSRQGKVRGGVAGPVAGGERGCKNLLLKRWEVLVQRDRDLQYSAAKTWKHTGWVCYTQKC